VVDRDRLWACAGISSEDNNSATDSLENFTCLRAARQSPRLARPAGCVTSLLQLATVTLVAVAYIAVQFMDRQINFRLIIDSHSSVNAEDLARIGLVDFEITGLKGIVKNK